MRLFNILFIWFFLAVGSSYSQDSTAYQARVKPHISPVIALQDDFYASPALKRYQRNEPYTSLSTQWLSSKQDLYLMQEGNGRRGLSVNASSYLKPNSATTIWGAAYYVNQKIKRINYNESIDYDLVYPYLMADTVGGTMSAETYFFSGGLSKQVKSFNYAFMGSFRGVQAYRSRDPRPKDLSSTLDATLSVSKYLNQSYVLSADLIGKKYGQSNNLKFENRLGAPLVFHDAGLGVYNELLAGSRTSATYSATAFGGQLNFSPKQKRGVVLQTSYQVFNLQKSLLSIPYAVGEVKDVTYRLMAGYMTGADKQNLTIRAQFASGKREGTEAKFNNRDSESSIEKISEDIRFVDDRSTASLQMVYGNKASFIDWYIGLKGEFTDHDLQYVSPSRNLSYANLSSEIELTGIKTFGKTILSATCSVRYLNNLSSSYSWKDVNPISGIYAMLVANYDYLRSNQTITQGSLRLDYPTSHKTTLFINAVAGHTAYDYDLKGSSFAFSAGFIF